MTVQVAKILNLPIEEPVRDLDARILLPRPAVKAQLDIVFGQRWL